jgi:hypothetical protein
MGPLRRSVTAVGASFQTGKVTVAGIRVAMCALNRIAVNDAASRGSSWVDL